MASRLDIYVSNIIDVVSGGYEYIKVYRSTSETAGFSEATVSGTRPVLSSDTTRYRYEDAFGSADHWYKYSFFAGSGLESSLSDSLRGTVSGTSFNGATFPPESNFTSAELDTIYRLRQIVGDSKEVNRDYLSPDTSYDNVSEDGFTVELDNPKGWPLSISIDGVEFQTIADPVVQGYTFLTFSGTQISTTSGTIADIWYEHFRYSDRELIEIYTKSDPPCGLTAEQTTPEMYELMAAITVLESELRGFMSTSGQRVDIYEEIEIDPSSGLGARLKDLNGANGLKERLKCLVAAKIKQLVSNNLNFTGYRIE